MAQNNIQCRLCNVNCLLIVSIKYTSHKGVRQADRILFYPQFLRSHDMVREIDFRKFN